ncbi:class II glutamine amidotransferase, partial [Candidatus Woesebacteria bacterium]|nr:class II glutamine amidotransferase [Candidatus Woesebacteria bacterium]
MCGIFGYIGNKTNAAEVILEGLKSLEYRGYDSWGVAIKNSKEQLFIEKHTGKIADATLPPMQSSLGIGHTRWATHGGVTRANAHPHVSCNKKIAVVHNGIVENYEVLKKKLLTQGHVFQSQTDSEVLVHQIEEDLKTEHDLRQVM